MAGAARDGKGHSHGKARRRKAQKKPQGEDLTHALNHEVRRDILRLLHSSAGSCSSGDMAAKLNQTPARVGYHIRVLRRHGAIALAEVEPVRNSIKHFYASKVEAHPVVLGFLEKTKKADKALALGQDDKQKSRAS